MHSLDPNTTLIPLAPRPDEYALRTEDILRTIEEQGDEIALVMFSGVQFYTGQCFEMQKITAAGHAKVRSSLQRIALADARAGMSSRLRPSTRSRQRRPQPA